VDVAYVRVMLIGPGGVGKSSLLCGLMNKKLPQAASSTQLADTFNLRPSKTYWAKSIGGGHWKMITDDDEINDLALLFEKICSRESSSQVPSANIPQSREEYSRNDYVEELFDKIDNISCLLEPQ
jgi:GTPase SAR1 family protein